MDNYQIVTDSNKLYVQYSHETQNINSPIVRTGIPQECLALYINPNPRSLEKAAKNGLKKLADLITKPYGGYNPQVEIMSEIQKAKGNKVFMDFDIDHKGWEEIKDEVLQFINKDALHIVQTRGGIHLLIETAFIAEEHKRHFYNGLTSLDYVDIHGDNMIPVPGTFQGGYTPNFIKTESYERRIRG